VSINSIRLDVPAAQAQPPTDRGDPRANNASGTRDVQDQNPDVQSGNVTSLERVSDDVKKSAIDAREPARENLPERRRRRGVNTRA
jgi:hypothetical protein